MKKFLSVLLVFTMMFTFALSSASAQAEGTSGETVQLVITPDKTSVAANGEDVEVTYTIKIKPRTGQTIRAFEFTLEAPEGMTLATDTSGYKVNKIDLIFESDLFPNGIFEKIEYTPASKKFIAYGGNGDRCLKEEAQLMTIKATIASDKTGEFILNAVNFGAFPDGEGTPTQYATEVISTPVIITQAIDEANVSIDPPSTGGTPQTSVSGTGWTGNITWDPAVAGTFVKNTVYTATVELTPSEGYVFTTDTKVKIINPEEEVKATFADGKVTFSKAFPATILPAYTGTAADTPTVASQKVGAVTFDAVTVENESVEYGYKKAGEQDYGNWQTESSFSNLPAGSYVFVARVAENDKHAAGGVSETPVPVTIYSAPTITYDTSSLSNLVVNTAISTIMPTVEGGATGGSFEVNGDLPTGLSINTQTGAISGTPEARTEAGGSVSVTYTDKDGNQSAPVTVNYGAVAGEANTLTVTQADITYGQTPEPKVTTNGNEASIKYKVKDAADDTYTTTAPKTAGTYTVKATSTGSTTVADAVATADFTIMQKAITVTVKQATMTYGGTIPTFTGTVADGELVNDDDYADLGLTLRTDKTSASPVGSYAVELASVTNPNYDVTVNGKNALIIEPASFTVHVLASQNIKVGSGLSAITVTDNVQGIGVNEQKLPGSFGWFTDSNCATAAKDSDISAKVVGNTIDLFWQFTLNPANNNYVATKPSGKTTFTIVEGDPQMLNFAENAVTKIYGDAAFIKKAENDRTDGGAITYASSDTSVATVNANTGEVTVLKPGTANITATAAAVPGKYAAGTTSYTLTVNPKTVSVNAGTYRVSKVYDKTMNCGAGSGDLDISGILTTDSGVSVNVQNIDGYNDANVGKSTVKVTLSLNGDTDGKYRLENNEIEVPAEITAKLITTTLSAVENQVFNGTAQQPAVSVYEETVSEDNKIPVDQYKVEYENNTDVGTATIKVSPVEGGNYTWNAPATYSFEIVKADAPTLSNVNVRYKYTDKTEHQVANVTAMLPSNCGIYTVTPAITADANNIIKSVSAKDGVVSVQLKGGAIDQTATITCTIKTQNYKDTTLNIIITLTDKDAQAPLVISSAKSMKYGEKLTLTTTGGSSEGEVSYTIVDGNDVAEVDGNTLTAKKAGTVKVKATKAGDDNYNDITSDVVEITVEKATPTGAVNFPAVSASGKKLSEITPDVSKLVPAGGTFAWTLGGDTEIKANQSYEWTYTPKDEDLEKYQVLSGSAVLWKQSTGGGYPSTPSDNVTNSGTAGTDSATTNADINTSVSNGTASAVVDKTTADKIVDKATSNQSTEIVVDAKTSAGTAENTKVTLPTETVQKIAEKTEAEVTVKTDAAEVTLDQKTVETVASKAAGSTVEIVVEKTKDETKEMEFELKVVSGGVVIGEFDGGNVKVTVKLNTALNALKNAALTCVYIDDNGTYRKVGGAKNNDGTYTFITTHFSSYAIMAEEEADEIIAEQTLGDIKNVKLVARTVMSKAKGKKAVKVYWYAADGSKVELDGVEVFRSTKRYSGFGKKPIFTTTKAQYYNTAVKVGTKYYYKVRGYKVIDGEKYYTDYSTKAWRTVK